MARVLAEILTLLVCPACHQPLRLLDAPESVVCEACGRAYPVRDGIPVLVAAEAEGRSS